jgi:hypothetical protein
VVDTSHATCIHLHPHGWNGRASAIKSSRTRALDWVATSSRTSTMTRVFPPFPVRGQIVIKPLILNSAAVDGISVLVTVMTSAFVSLIKLIRSSSRVPWPRLEAFHMTQIKPAEDW